MHCMDGNNINMIRGDTVRLDIEITDADGNPYKLKDGDELLFTVKKAYLMMTSSCKRRSHRERSL